MAIIKTPVVGVSPYKTIATTPIVLRADANGNTVLANPPVAAAVAAADIAATNANSNVYVTGQEALNRLITTNSSGVFAGANVTINLEEQIFSTTNQVTSNTNYPSGNIGEIQYNSGSNSFASDAYFTYTNSNIITPGIRTDGYFYANGAPFIGGSSNYSNSNVSSFLAAFGSNVVSTTGNITGGNLTTTGTANVASLAVTGSVTVQGSIGVSSWITVSSYLSANGNILTGNNVSAAGNITGNFFFGNGSQLTGVVSSYGNANVIANLAALGSNPVSTTGNVTGGNLLFGTGIVSGTGNISGNYFIGNGSQLTGISGSATLPLANGTSNINIATANGNVTITANGSPTWTFNTDGNLSLPTAGNIVGAVNIIGNGTGNVNVEANGRAWTFAADGNLVLPLAGNIVNYGNTWNFGYNGTTQFPANVIQAPAGSPITVRTTSGNSSSRFAAGDNFVQIGLQDDTTGAYQAWAYVETDMANVNTPQAVVILKPGDTGNEVRWYFDALGNLTLPGNIIAINYANGNRVTGNITFRDEIVIGTGTSNLISGLYLAPSSSSADANMYLRVRGNITDEPTHIHFDTGNNAYYNQFIGDDNKYIQLANTGNIVINTNDLVGNAAQWTFAANGNLTFPTGNLVITPDLAAEANAAVISSTDHVLALVSNGVNGGVQSVWVEDIANIGTSNIAAVRVSPVSQTGNVQIQTGNNSSYNTWTFSADGNLTLPSSLIVPANSIITGVGASPAPSINGFDTINAITFSASGNITGNNLAATNLVINSITSDDSTFVTIEDGVNITTGSISSQENLSLTANAYTWTFRNDGVGIVLPYSATIRDTNGGSLAIGVGAGALALGNTAVAVGYQAAFLAQGNNSVAIGRSAGETQGEQAVAIGLNAGRQQGNYAVAIGKFSANSSQGEYSVAIGPNAGFENQLSNAVSIGSQAGASSQGINSVAVGVSAAYLTQGNNAVAVGNSAGYLLQGNNSVAIGDSAGIFYQGNYSVAVGYLAGNNTQGGDSVAVGVNSGGQLQGTEAVAVGSYAGYISQGNLSVAVGRGAGENSQGANSVAVGHLAGRTNQGNNSIILNATGANLEQTTANTFTVAPVRNDVANIAEVMFYNATSKEITYGNTISVTGNITGNYFFGNGSQLTNVAPTASLPICIINSSVANASVYKIDVNLTVTNPSGATISEIGIFLPGFNTGNIAASQIAASNTAGTQTQVLANITTNTRLYAQVYATNTNGTAYSPPFYLAAATVCLLAGTMITLADGTHKAIEDITYTDKLLSWDFDRGCYAETTAMWIKRSETGSQYNLLTFSDGTTLRTFDQHRIFNKQAGAFTYPMTAATPVGTVTVNEHGQEITLINKQVIQDTIEYYNVITDYHMNLFSDSVLTSCRFNNIYPITDMKFAKDSRTLRTRAEFENVPDRFFHGLRLAEQTYDLDMIEWYVTRLLSLEISTHAELAV